MLPKTFLGPKSKRNEANFIAIYFIAGLKYNVSKHLCDATFGCSLQFLMVSLRLNEFIYSYNKLILKPAYEESSHFIVLFFYY